MTNSVPILQKILSITPSEFEQLCAVLLQSMGFSDIFPRKSGSQTGRDIDAKLNNTKNSKLEQWYFECKRYTGTVPFKEIVDKFYLIHRLSPAPDALVILSSGQLANDVNDFLESYAEDLDFPILKLTNEPPDFRFNNWILEYQNEALGFLNDIGPTDRDPSPMVKKTLDLLLAEQAILTHPSIRIERALRLGAYPRLVVSWSSIQGYFNTIRMIISNVGNGFADDIKLVIIYRGTVIAERNYQAIPEKSFQETEVSTSRSSAHPEKPEESDIDSLTILLTYRNALNYSFQSTCQIIAEWSGNSHSFRSGCKSI